MGKIIHKKAQIARRITLTPSHTTKTPTNSLMREQIVSMIAANISGLFSAALFGSEFHSFAFRTELVGLRPCKHAHKRPEYPSELLAWNFSAAIPTMWYES